MSSSFVRASTTTGGNCYNLNAIVTAAPFSVACIFRSNSTSTTSTGQCLWTVYNNGGANTQRHSLTLPTQSSATVQAQSEGASISNAVTSNTFSANEWNLAVGVWASTSSRTAYLNGSANKGTNTGTQSPTGIDLTRIGLIRRAGATTFPMDGEIACMAVWNVALSDADVDSMIAKTTNPRVFNDLRLIRPDALVGYSEFARDEERDIIWQQDWTSQATINIDEHPPIIRHYHRTVPFVAPIVAATIRTRTLLGVGV